MSLHTAGCCLQRGARMQKSGLHAACAATALLACAGAGHAADGDTMVTKHRS